MLLNFEVRLSDSPLVERVWRCRTEYAGEFSSIAANHFEIVFTRHHGTTCATLRGPETRASRAECPADGEWLGIRFRLGTFMPALPPGALRDRRDVNLPGATSRSFWLDGSPWDYPSFENADTFVSRLARRGVIARDGIIDSVLRGLPHAVSTRSAQRHFRRATGLTHGTARQIERARHATNLLKQGMAIREVVHEAGYFDQAHLTRSVKYLIGQTPAEIVRGEKQLSFLYKTTPFARV